MKHDKLVSKLLILHLREKVPCREPCLLTNMVGGRGRQRHNGLACSEECYDKGLEDCRGDGKTERHSEIFVTIVFCFHLPFAHPFTHEQVHQCCVGQAWERRWPPEAAQRQSGKGKQFLMVILLSLL